MQHKRVGAALVAIGALAALPAGAQAATKTVFMGAPPNVAGPLEKKGVESLNYFPLKTTIRVGDKVKFVVNGFHTLELKTPGAGGGPGGGPSGPKVMGALDAAGQPFWFNGQSAGGPGGGGPPGRPAFGKSFTLPSPKGFSSGFPFARKPKPITIAFAKARTYNFFCLIHGGMETSVKVVGKTGAVPSPKADARALARQVASVKKIAQGLSKTPVPAKTVSMGAEKAGTHFFGFLPGTLSVAPGTTVTFKMPTATRETHTATFGPGDPNKEPTSYLGKLAKSVESPETDPAVNFPSEKPGTLASYGPSLHGNGFWNSGPLDGSPKNSSSRLRFDTPGTYTYYCLLHPYMSGKVKVG
jgi:plastocyanin